MESMFDIPCFETIDDLLNKAYFHILKNGKRVIGKRGPIIEVTNFAATLTNSRARTSFSLDRRFVRSKFAEFAWYLSADPNKEIITPYIKAYNKEEADNNMILGAYGPKIFGKGLNETMSQFDRVCEQIKLRSDTKQAYISISDISDYNIRKRKYMYHWSTLLT